MHDLVVLDGSTFFVSEESGDVDAKGPDGFFFADMRHLSRWQLLLDREPLRILTSMNLYYYGARILGTHQQTGGGPESPITLRRDRFVSDGVHEDLYVENSSDENVQVTIEVHFATDFADIMTVRSGRPCTWPLAEHVGNDRVVLESETEGQWRATEILFTQKPTTLTGESARFDLRLAARSRWHTCIEISPGIDGHFLRAQHHDLRDAVRPRMPQTLEQWLDSSPTLETDWQGLNDVYQQSLVDLAALRFRPREDLSYSLPAAGLPWFMALFGRDSLITSYHALPFHAELAQMTLYMLAELQGREDNAFRDEEPGKIPHELRRDVLTAAGRLPHDPYYGSADATLLYLILLDEYERWTGDIQCIRNLEGAARGALTWMWDYGDSDGDGYIEYRMRSPKGLRNQCWKDSDNSILFADGSLAQPPIATCELQGYAYDARLRTARLAREVWDDLPLAERLEREAQELRERFQRDFWDEERRAFALALDGEKRRVDSVTSNIGHLLWSGILDQDQAEVVASRLMASDMFTGWGIRTMSAEDGGYNPIEYHNGTVWPFDTSLIAEGLRRYGLREEAARLSASLIDAALFFDNRLPEVFAGFGRDELGLPIEYPTASRPQAWSTGTPLLILRTMLGLDVRDGRLECDPHLPSSARRLRLVNLNVRGTRIDVP